MPGSSDNPRSGSAVASGREFASSFFKSVLILTSPLYLLTALTSNGKQLRESKSLQGGLYISLATLIPMVSALLVTSGKEERYQLCSRCFRFYRDKWLWYSIAGLGGPFLYALSYYTVIILYPNQSMAGPMISLGQITILVPSIIVIHIMAATEEIADMQKYHNFWQGFKSVDMLEIHKLLKRLEDLWYIAKIITGSRVTQTDDNTGIFGLYLFASNTLSWFPP